MTESQRTRVTVHSTRGMVAAAHPLAAAVGARLLAQGGNAFDAAAGTAAALGVVEPFMSGLAGMGMATCFAARDKAVMTLDFVPRNPSALAIGDLLRPSDLKLGARSFGVPGNLGGWAALVDRFGCKSFAEALAPAIELAREGVPLTAFSVDEIRAAAPLVAAKGDDIFRAWASTYLIKDRIPQTGDVLKQPALARTLEAIAAGGIAHLYGGSLGRALVRHAASHGSYVRMADLEAYKPIWRPAIVAGYRDLLVNVPPPPAEAFQYLLTLRVLEGVPLKALPHNGVEHLDLVLRAIRLAAGIRIANNLADCERVEELLSEGMVARLRERLLDRRPIEGPTEQFVVPVATAPQHTTSLSVADKDGNAVCLTQSLGSVFGCNVVLAEHGVCLNNFLSFGDIHPMATKRIMPNGPLALPLAPSLALREGVPVLALGTPGSYGIPQHQTQVLVRWTDFGLGLQEAIEAPRARLTDGRAVLLESRLDCAVVDELEKRGHEVERGPAWTRKVGGVQGVAIDSARQVFSGGADPRRDGYAAAP